MVLHCAMPEQYIYIYSNLVNRLTFCPTGGNILCILCMWSKLRREFLENYLFVVGNDTLTDIVSYTANLSFGTWSNVESYDVYINGDYFGTDVQNIQITTNDILRIDVVKTDDGLESTIQFNNLLV